MSENAELMILMILGLNPKKPDALRRHYGRLLLMCCQEVDRSHVKGLVVNLMHQYWPDLLRSVGATISSRCSTHRYSRCIYERSVLSSK